MKKFERFAVIGDPISHSLSPAMQLAAFAAAGVEATYGREQVSPSDLRSWVRGARALPYTGFNVTIPHKVSIAPLLDSLDASAQRVGAVNTVANRAGNFIGYNTDLSGFSAIIHSCLLDPGNRCAVVLGAGGSARAVVRSLADLGFRLMVCNRSEERARTLVAALDIPARTSTPDRVEARAAIESADILVNTTPLGMSHLPISPLPRGTELNPRTVVVDLVYGPATPLVREARATGCTVIDGIEMLVQQGAAAFHLWTGLAPDLDIMRTACRRSLLEVQTCSVS